MNSYDEMKAILDEAEVVITEKEDIKIAIAASLNDVRASKNKIAVSVELSARDFKTYNNEVIFVDDTPVFAYIRRGRNPDKKFHFTYCTAITDNESSKFYCTTESSGKFPFDLEDDSGVLVEESKLVELQACEFCVGNYFNLTGANDGGERKKKVSEITPSTIKQETSITFNKHAWFSRLYKHTDKSWKEISYDVRKNSGWRCQECDLVLGEEGKAFLHTHHINHDRNHNHYGNLIAVCIGCHAEFKNHQGLKKTDAYKVFFDQYCKS